MPKRIQLRRTKGWKKPPGCVVVSRPSPFGNPFKIQGYRYVYPDATPEEAAAGCVKLYREFISKVLAGGMSESSQANAIRARWSELRGKDLGCWCAEGQPCHADVLLALANKE